MTLDPPAAVSVPLLRWREDWRVALAFLTILPMRLPEALAGVPVSAAARAFPLVGVVVGAAGGAVYAGVTLAGLAPVVGAILAVGAMAIVTGGLHEDGLADFADALGARGDRERLLAVMRDSRLGAMGALGLMLVTGLRVAALSLAASPIDGALMILAAAVGSRASLPAVMYLMTPARAEGLGFNAGRPDRRRVVDAGMLGLLIVVAALGPVVTLPVVAVVVLAVLVVARLAERRLGGHTGDVLGCIQQVGECAVLITILAVP
jgi:adenosylcobinamide-GDP ribazoletransferase